jgi:hypothetical protein
MMILHLTSIDSPSAGPDGLSEFEGVVMASDTPALMMISRAWTRELLEYVRRLEREIRREGAFW